MSARRYFVGYVLDDTTHPRKWNHAELLDDADVLGVVVLSLLDSFGSSINDDAAQDFLTNVEGHALAWCEQNLDTVTA